MIDMIVCDRSGVEKLTALEYIQKLNESGISVGMPDDENDIQIYSDKLFAPEFLSGRQYLEATAVKSNCYKGYIEDVITYAATECGFTRRHLKAPIRVYNLYERKRLQIAQAIVENKKFCIFEYVFDAFDENNIGIALTSLVKIAESAKVIIIAKDSAHAFDLNARVWRMDGE